jgi:hypothetical protein
MHILARTHAQGRPIQGVMKLKRAEGSEYRELHVIGIARHETAGVNHAKRAVGKFDVHCRAVIGIKGILADPVAGGLVKGLEAGLNRYGHHVDGKGGEIQLTDAIRLLIQDGGKVYGVRLRNGERRYDIGNFESYFRAFVEFALADEKYGAALRDYLAVFQGDLQVAYHP